MTTTTIRATSWNSSSTGSCRDGCWPARWTVARPKTTSTWCTGKATTTARTRGNRTTTCSAVPTRWRTSTIVCAPERFASAKANTNSQSVVVWCAVRKIAQRIRRPRAEFEFLIQSLAVSRPFRFHFRVATGSVFMFRPLLCSSDRFVFIDVTPETIALHFKLKDRFLICILIFFRAVNWKYEILLKDP